MVENGGWEVRCILMMCTLNRFTLYIVWNVSWICWNCLCKDVVCLTAWLRAWLRTASTDLCRCRPQMLAFINMRGNMHVAFDCPCFHPGKRWSHSIVVIALLCRNVGLVYCEVLLYSLGLRSVWWREFSLPQDWCNRSCLVLSSIVSFSKLHACWSPFFLIPTCSGLDTWQHP